MRNAFTVKALLIGLLGGAFINFAAYANDYLVGSTYFVGNHLPVSVLSFFFLLSLCYRPLVSRLPRFFQLSNPEIAVIAVILFASCSLPTSSLMRIYPALETTPYAIETTRQNWQTHKSLSYTPDRLVPVGWYREGEDPALDKALGPRRRLARERLADRVNTGFYNGLVSGKTTIYFWKTRETAGAIPLRPWLPVVKYWFPLFVFFFLFIIMLMIIVHKQWSQNELLPYPIAEFTAAVVYTEPGRRLPAVFYERKFWIGFALTFSIQFVRWVHAWYPETMINIPLEWHLWPIRAKFPNFFAHGYFSWNITNGVIRPTAVAFAYFIPTDVSFSLGIGVFAVAFFSYILWAFGYPNYGTYHHTSTLFGAYAGMFLIIVYLGRRYYWNVFRAAFGLKTNDQIEPYIRQSARGLLLGFVGLVACCMIAGLPLFFALVVVVMFAVLFVVLARIVAETGNICVQSWWKPIDLIFKLLGAAAIGPRTLSVMSLITTPLCVDARECLSCFMINGLKLSDSQRVHKFRLGMVTTFVLVPCMIIAFLMVLWVNYNGRHTWDGWSHGAVPRMVFDRVTDCITTLQKEPGLFQKVMAVEHGRAGGPLAGLAFRLRHVRVEPGVLPWVIFGFAAILVCSWLRLRFSWWFIHPVLFLYWGTPPAVWFAWSFLLGSVIKGTVVRYGGGRVYQAMKPFFIGAIMGELAVVAVMMVFNVLYYFQTGERPITFFVFPR